MSERPYKDQSCHVCRFSSERFNYNDHHCLRHSPADPFTATRGVQDHGRWPLVKAHEWCGDFERHPTREVDPRW